MNKLPSLRVWRNKVRWALRAVLPSRGLRRNIIGRNNVLQLAPCILRDVVVDIVGDGNHIRIGQDTFIQGLLIYIRGNGHQIEIGERCSFTRGGAFWMEDTRGVLSIGAETTIESAHIAVTEPGSRVLIGQDCMLATEIEIRTGDSHSLLDAATGQRLNFAQDVILHDHVWVAARALILKGVEIGAHSVVAAGAVVTRSCEPGVIVAGNPARVVKTGITWERKRLYEGAPEK